MEADSTQRALERDAAELEEAATDPTLAACCRRDAEYLAANARLRAQLGAVDPSRGRERLREAVISNRAPDPLSDEDSDDDPQLEHMRQQRLLELEVAAGRRREQASAGFGRLRVVALAEAQRMVRTPEDPIVVHLRAGNASLAGDVSECLTLLSRRYLHVRFVEVDCPLDYENPGFPISQGIVVALPENACPTALSTMALEEFVDDEGNVVEEELERGLRARGVRAESQQDSYPSPHAKGFNEDEDSPRLAPCAACGRTYPHTHFSGVRTSRLAASHSDSE